VWIVRTQLCGKSDEVEVEEEEEEDEEVEEQQQPSVRFVGRADAWMRMGPSCGPGWLGGRGRGRGC
jgi:hypothetical protein